MILWAAAETQLKTRDISRKGAKHVLSPVQGAQSVVISTEGRNLSQIPSPPLGMMDLGPSATD